MTEVIVLLFVLALIVVALMACLVGVHNLLGPPFDRAEERIRARREGMDS